MTRLTEHINNCTPCMKRKIPRREPKAETQPLEMEIQDLEIGSVLSYDFKGPLPVADKSVLFQCKNRYVLTMHPTNRRVIFKSTAGFFSASYRQWLGDT